MPSFSPGGADPWSAAGPLAGFLRRATKADEGVGRGPGGPPHREGASVIDRWVITGVEIVDYH